jgi:hypothetical protein
MKYRGLKINRFQPILTPPHKKQFFLKKNLILFFVFFSNFDTPHSLWPSPTGLHAPFGPHPVVGGRYYHQLLKQRVALHPFDPDDHGPAPRLFSTPWSPPNIPVYSSKSIPLPSQRDRRASHPTPRVRLLPHPALLFTAAFNSSRLADLAAATPFVAAPPSDIHSVLRTLLPTHCTPSIGLYVTFGGPHRRSKYTI